MPSYVFTDTGPRTYPETRDACGIHLGTVTPGDVREFGEPPADGYWTPETPARSRRPGRGAAASGGTPDPGCGAGTAEGAAPAPQPGQPVPPAVIP